MAMKARECEFCGREFYFICVPCVERHGIPDFPVGVAIRQPLTVTIPLTASPWHSAN